MRKLRTLLGAATAALFAFLGSAPAAVPGTMILYWNAPVQPPGAFTPTGYTVYESNAVSGVFVRALASTNIQTFTNGGFVFTSLGVQLTNWDLSIGHWITVTSTNKTSESPLTNWVFMPTSPEPVQARAVPLAAILVPLPGFAQVSEDVMLWTGLEGIYVAPGPTTNSVWLTYTTRADKPQKFLRNTSPQPVPAGLLRMIHR